MTLPEHVICSVMIAQLGCRQRFGWKAVPVVAVAGISPDVDVVTKLISEPLFWEMVLGMWLAAAVCLYKWPARGREIAVVSLSSYAGYVLLRWLLPRPTGFWRQITGGWMYLAPG